MQKNKTVDVLLPNTSQYRVLHHFSAKLSEAVTRLGFRTRLLDRKQYSRLLFEDPPGFTMGFNGAPVDEQGEFLCDRALVPHISCLVDPPYRFLSLQQSPYILVGCDDRCCTNLFKTALHPHYYFFPHGIEPELIFEKEGSRPFDVVFLGSCIDYETRRQLWSERFSASVCLAMRQAADFVFSGAGVHFMQAFLEAANDLAREGQLESFDLSEALQELELYVKGRDRVDLIRSIRHTKVDVFGGSIDAKGWSEVLKGQKNIVIHPEVTFDQALQIMRQAKIILNSGMKSVEGAHERVLSGVAAGAAVLTSQNRYLAESFQDDASILFYHPAHLDLVEDKVQKLLVDEEQRRALATRGQHIVRQHHTWDNHLRLLLDDILPVIDELAL